MIEAMKQALEALENLQRFVEASANAKMLHGWGEQLDTAEDAIASLQQAIKKLESQEPVAWQVHPFDYGIGHKGVYARTDRPEQVELWKRKGWNVQPLHTYPPAAQRTWVGLTDDEIAQGWKESWVTEQAWQSAVWWAEDKLKEKNT